MPQSQSRRPADIRTGQRVLEVGSGIGPGISYGYTIQSVRALTDSATQYYDYLNFLNINGPNQLDGIKSSTRVGR